MNNIDIFGFAPSTYVQTIRLTAQELDQPVSLLPLEFGQPSHAALHPFLKMPAMRHGDIQLFETLAIATYLCEKAATDRLVPGKLEYKCQMLCWISAAIDYYYPALVSAALSKNINMEECGNLLRIVDETLSKTPYLAGPELSLADLFLLPMVVFIEKQAACDGQRPFKRLDNWLQALKNRNGYAEIMTND